MNDRRASEPANRCKHRKKLRIDESEQVHYVTDYAIVCIDQYFPRQCTTYPPHIPCLFYIPPPVFKILLPMLRRWISIYVVKNYLIEKTSIQNRSTWIKRGPYRKYWKSVEGHLKRYLAPLNMPRVRNLRELSALPSRNRILDEYSQYRD